MREDARVLKNWRKINCWAQIITRRSRYGFWWFVLNNWFFFNFLTPAPRVLTHKLTLFLFPIVFGINTCTCNPLPVYFLPECTVVDLPSIQQVDHQLVNTLHPGSLFFTTSLLWNSLSSPLRSPTFSLPSFRKQLMKYLGFPVIRPVVPNKTTTTTSSPQSLDLRRSGGLAVQGLVLSSSTALHPAR